MDLLALNPIFLRVLDFLGHGHELCFALANKKTLKATAQAQGHRSKGGSESALSKMIAATDKADEFAASLADTPAFAAEMSLIMTKQRCKAVSPRQLNYFVSTASLREYARDSLGLVLLGKKRLLQAQLRAVREGDQDLLEWLVFPPVRLDGAPMPTCHGCHLRGREGGAHACVCLAARRELPLR